MNQCELIIKGKYIITMNPSEDLIMDGFVAVDNGIIAAVGHAGAMQDYDAKETLDAGNSIIMPGLINTHTHAAMAYFRGLADDLPLDTWLKDHIWPSEAKFIDPGFIRKGCELACLEMLKSGVACFNDMYFFDEIAAEIVKNAGMRAVLGDVILDFPTPSAKTPNETIDKTLRLFEQYKDDEQVKFAFNPHSVYALGKEYLKRVSELSDEHGILIHIHLSETKNEADECRKKYSLSPVGYLDHNDFLSSKVIAAHAVWLDEYDLNILHKKEVKISHNPISNMKLASGTAPLPKLLQKGMTVGLGTDGAASNNTLDMFSEMRVCALLHKAVHLDPTIANAKEIVTLATIEGAKVLGLDEKIGSLELGKKADLITIGLDKPHLMPIYDPYSHLVYCAEPADVDNVVICGKILMKGREMQSMDEERIIFEAATSGIRH